MNTDNINSFKCPISLEIMEDPVVAGDGFTYDKANIEEWLKNNSTSPITNIVMKSKILVSNNHMFFKIREYNQKYNKHSNIKERDNVGIFGIKHLKSDEEYQKLLSVNKTHKNLFRLNSEKITSLKKSIASQKISYRFDSGNTLKGFRVANQISLKCLSFGFSV